MSKKGLRPTERKIVDTRSNQWVSNPKQESFVAYYIDVKSKDTFGNVYQSALKAGYSDSYARKIASSSVANQWIAEYVKKRVLEPEHIIQGITNLAITSIRDSDKLKAYELLAKLEGMLVDRTANMNVNIEAALKDLR